MYCMQSFCIQIWVYCKHIFLPQSQREDNSSSVTDARFSVKQFQNGALMFSFQQSLNGIPVEESYNKFKLKQKWWLFKVNWNGKFRYYDEIYISILFKMRITNTKKHLPHIVETVPSTLLCVFPYHGDSMQRNGNFRE